MTVTNGSVFVGRSLTCGGPYDTWPLTVISNGTTVLGTDAIGDASVKDNMTAGGNVVAGSQVTSAVRIGGNPGHQVIDMSLWAYAAGAVTLTTNDGGEDAANGLPGLPSASAERLSVSGRVVSMLGTTEQSCRLAGPWTGSASGTLSLKSFGATGDDGPSWPPAGWGLPGAVDAASNIALIKATNLPSTTDCTAQVAETVIP